VAARSAAAVAATETEVVEMVAVVVLWRGGVRGFGDAWFGGLGDVCVCVWGGGVD
jgi:hypothetical protein